MVAAALKLGYRHIDTAWKYGTERGVGEGIRASGVPRGESSSPPRCRTNTCGPPTSSARPRRACRRSASISSTSCSCTGPIRKSRSPSRSARLRKMKRRGLARHIGVANFNIALLDEAIRLSPEAARHPAGRVSPLPRPDEGPAGVPPTWAGAYRLLPARSWPADQRSVVGEIARARGKSVAQIALRWLVQQGNIAADPALIEPQAHRREPRRFRLCADGRRDEAHRRAQAAGRQDRQSRRPRAGMGLMSLFAPF